MRSNTLNDTTCGRAGPPRFPQPVDESLCVDLGRNFEDKQLDPRPTHSPILAFGTGRPPSRTGLTDPIADTVTVTAATGPKINAERAVTLAADNGAGRVCEGGDDLAAAVEWAVLR